MKERTEELLVFSPDAKLIQVAYSSIYSVLEIENYRD
jgi:hypothetical protein